MSVHVFGIRHHGPGSARSLRAALAQLAPDAVLVEGPPDGDSMLSLLRHSQMHPPVALLIYAAERSDLSTYYPFAVFSPEWQALQYGLGRGIPTRFMDLPPSHRLALAENLSVPEPQKAPSEENPLHRFRGDPLLWLAAAAGYSDGERWWEHMVEQRRGDDIGLFSAILEAMTALREALPPSDDPLEAMREAWMRRTIRATQKAGCERIAVVCGAWHAPALATLPPEKRDSDLLKGLPRIKVIATWVPWTYGRLTFGSGYGAGIESPGWYHHLWESERDVATGWMARVARLLRAEDLDASPAQVIDAVRTAEALAALRDRPIPGLPELNEAAQAVFCFGSGTPMNLIWRKLIVSERLGDVPDITPAVPLQTDLQREQRRLRLKPEPEERRLELDLRDPLDLDRSRLLHRLAMLDIEWGKRQRATGRERGTFREYWRLRWQPEFAVDLIEASMWGNTVYEAATAYACGAADSAPDLPTLAILLDDVLLAALPDAAGHLMRCVQDKAALAGDVAHLMDALPPLGRVLRYSDVRQTDRDMVRRVVDGLVARVCIGLPGACASLDDEAAAAIFSRIVAVNSAIALLQDADHLHAWHTALRRLADQPALHGLVAGRCHRLLHDAGALDAAETARRFGLALSTASEPAQAAAWIEGFLRESGLILLHDDALWAVIDGWLTGLRGETFEALLPLIRRTFATFSAPERRQMGERVTRRARPVAVTGERFDATRAAAALARAALLLGVAAHPGESSATCGGQVVQGSGQRE